MNPATNVVDFYNTNHTFWKSVPLITSPGFPTNSPRIIHISEKIVNNDNQLEVLYEHYGFGTTGRYQGRVTNDLGGTLMIYDVKQSSAPVLHRFPDGTTKLIVYQDTASQTYTRIYGFPMTIPAGVQEAAGASLSATIAPNPAEGILNITFASVAPRTVTLHNLQGQQVLIKESTGAAFSCNVAGLPRGLYGVTVLEGGKRSFEKVVLQ